MVGFVFVNGGEGGVLGGCHVCAATRLCGSAAGLANFGLAAGCQVLRQAS
jgi:hypothetical protein